MKRRQWVRWGVLATLWASGCNGGDTQPPGPPADVVPSGGAGQNWYFNNPLPTPLSVTVSDLSGRPVPGVVVMWTVESGGGAVSPVQSTTDQNGIASTSDSVGSSTIQRVSAAVDGVPSPASFNEIATSAPTSAAVDVKDDFFDPATTIVQVNGTVTWTFRGAIAHTVTFTGGSDSGTPQASGTFGPITFTTVGSSDYHCKVHPAKMTGKVTVVH